MIALSGIVGLILEQTTTVFLQKSFNGFKPYVDLPGFAKYV